MRVGCGYDSHRFVEGRTLVLGGVGVPYERGLAGWSDADAVVHAVIDALCGAANLGDIGTLFPPGDQRYRDVSSIALLEQIIRKLESRRLIVANLDVTILAQEPVLAPYVPSMRASLAFAMRLDEGQVSVKAKTNEYMGFIGRSEGIAALAVALVESSH